MQKVCPLDVGFIFQLLLGVFNFYILKQLNCVDKYSIFWIRI